MNATAAAQLTSNQYYRGLNRRFEKRSRLLRRIGYRYQIIPIRADLPKSPTTAVFVSRYGSRVISASEVMHADTRAWRDELSAYRLAR
jgi:hypothetical protein